MSAESFDHEFTLVIPAFNEQSRLPQTLATLALRLDLWQLDYRVLIVDDGSCDDTRLVAARFGPRFATVRLRHRTGKGAAIRHGMLASTGRFVGFTDADLPFDLEAMRTALDIVAAGDADVVFGARDAVGAVCRVRRRFARRVATRLFRTLAGRMLNLAVTDPQCALKVFTRNAARQIFARAQLDGFAFDSEVTVLAHALGLRVRAIPVTWLHDDSSTISLWRDGVPMAIDLLRLRARHAPRHHGDRPVT